jgi:hypothetical protein
MSRILFWNIENYAIAKVNDPDLTVTGKRRRSVAGGLSPNEASTQRVNLIAAVFVACAPDVIVINEVSSGDDGQVRATNTGGIQGAVWLLNALRAANPAMEWRMVPPLRIGTGGPQETMAVLYRGVTGPGTPGQVTRYFTGPNLWQGAQNGTSVVPAVGVVGNAYPGVVAPGDPDLNAMLVLPATAARNIPAGALHNGGGAIPEDTVAARIAFQRTLPLGGGAVAYGNFRQPYMVTFTEQNLAGALRNLTVFGIHAPPNVVGATQIINNLSISVEVTAALGANETRVIGGDFNLELLAAGGGPSGVYAPLAPYQPLIQSLGAPPGVLPPPLPPVPPPPAPAPLTVYRGFFSTHIKRSKKTLNSRILWSDAANASPYPGYGYHGSDRFPFVSSIDNILVWPLQGPPYNYRTTIMNPVVGTPFVAPYLIAGAPIGTVVLAPQMNAPLLAPLVWPPHPYAPYPTTQGGRAHLVGWTNYGRIRSTSDHFAVFAEV